MEEGSEKRKKKYLSRNKNVVRDGKSTELLQGIDASGNLGNGVGGSG